MPTPVPRATWTPPWKPRDRALTSLSLQSLWTVPGTSRTAQPRAQAPARPQSMPRRALAWPTRPPGSEPCPGPAPAPAELPWTNIDLKEPKRAPGHAAAGCPETASVSSLGLLPLGLEEPYGADDHPLWAWVSGGGCAVEPHAALKWFSVQSGEARCQGPGAAAGAPAGGREGGPPPCAPTGCPASERGTPPLCPSRQWWPCQAEGGRPPG